MSQTSALKQTCSDSLVPEHLRTPAQLSGHVDPAPQAREPRLLVFGAPRGPVIVRNLPESGSAQK
ncbi:MAG: hypothetical protein ACYCOU_14850, partial [Sulfobacillus sp.]